MAAGEGVSMPGCAMGVMPGVKEGVAPPIMGVAPPRLGVALPMVAGVSSQRERLRLGVGVVCARDTKPHGVTESQKLA